MEYSFSKSLDAFKSSAVREILKLTQGNSIISLAGGLPAEEFFPVEAAQEAFEQVFKQGTKALQYGLTDGYIPLRELICERLATKDMHVGVEDTILTTGSQQALDLLTRVYLDPEDVVLVERPTYLAAIQVFQSRGVKVVEIESDSFGMNLDDLAIKIREHKPKMVYVVPTFSNPTGIAWSLERRLGLLAACREHNILLIEDDPYGEIKYDQNENFPTIFSLDEHPNNSAVVYISTFSKTVAPAMRTGWAVGDSKIIQAMVRAKQAADLHSSSIDQQALYQLLKTFDLDGHIAKIRKNYEERMKLMINLLSQQGWTDIHWTEPKGGMFLWLELPEHINSEEMLKRAVQEGVAFVPGSAFFANTPKYNTLRLNFTHSDNETMMLGVQKFAKVVNDSLVIAKN